MNTSGLSEKNITQFCLHKVVQFLFNFEVKNFKVYSVTLTYHIFVHSKSVSVKTFIDLMPFITQKCEFKHDCIIYKILIQKYIFFSNLI